MRGPKIIAASMSVGHTRGKGTRKWQYHSRSDRHSKLACWAVLFDLLRKCDRLRARAAAGEVGFRVNHKLRGLIDKTLDLVITVADPTRKVVGRRTFADLAKEFGVVLDATDKAEFAALPVVYEDERDEPAEVAIALEAKACMTEHHKALPRLHAEILATGYLAKMAEKDCISVSYTLVNAADSFCTPKEPGFKVNRHAQPAAAQAAIDMIEAALPWASQIQIGYDAIGVTVIECKNDGTPVVLHAGPAAPQKKAFQYRWMIAKTCGAFRAKF